MTGKAQFPLSVVIGAIDKVSAPLMRARRSIQKSMLPIMKMQRSLTGLAKASGLDRVASQMGTVVQKTRKVASAIGSLTQRLVFMGAAAAAAFGAMVYSFTQFGDRVLATSKKLGVSVEWLQEMQYAADRTGTSIETLEGSMGKLSRNIAEAAAGNGAARQAFDSLGISVTNADGTIRKADAVFDEVTRKLEALESQELKNALAMRIFGRAGIEMMPMLGQGADEIARLRARARELGLVMSADAVAGAERLGDSISDLKAAGTGLTRTFLTALSPALKTLADKLTTIVVGWGPRVQAWSEGFAETLPQRLEDLRAKFDKFMEALDKVLAPLKVLADRFGTANVAAAAFVLIVGGPAILAVTSLGFALIKLGGFLLATTARIWIATGASARLISMLKLVGGTIWTKVIPAFWGWTTAILANPMTWLVLGIAAVIAAFAALGIWISKHLDDIKAWFKAAYDKIAGIFSGLADWVGGVFSGAWEAVKSAFTGVFDWIRDKVSWLTGWVPDWIKNLFGGKDKQIEVAGASAPAGVDGAAPAVSAGTAFGRHMGGGMFMPPKPTTSTQTNNARVEIRVVDKQRLTRTDLQVDRGMDVDFRTGPANAAFG